MAKLTEKLITLSLFCTCICCSSAIAEPADEATDSECGKNTTVTLKQQFENAGDCEKYTVNSSVCYGILTPQVDHIYIHSERKYGGASFVYGQQEIMNVVDGLLELVQSPDCIDVMKEVLCLFYYSPCGNETHGFLPPPSLCQDSCKTIMSRCSEDWERVLNASRMTDNDHLWFTDCAAEYLHNSNFQTVKTCCVHKKDEIATVANASATIAVMDITPTATVALVPSPSPITPTPTASVVPPGGSNGGCDMARGGAWFGTVAMVSMATAVTLLTIQ